MVTESIVFGYNANLESISTNTSELIPWDSGEDVRHAAVGQ